MGSFLLRWRPQRAEQIAGAAGLAGVGGFLVSLVGVQLASPDIDWIRYHYVSDFATGPLRWIFIPAVVVHGGANLALGWGLRSSLHPSGIRRWAVILFSVAAAGIAASALLPVDAADSARTANGLAHRVVVNVSFPSELAALFLFSAAFAGDPRWRRRTRASFVMSSTAAVALAALLLAVLVNRWPALAERLALASFMTWELWAALQLMRTPTTSANGVISATHRLDFEGSRTL